MKTRTVVYLRAFAAAAAITIIAVAAVTIGIPSQHQLTRTFAGTGGGRRGCSPRSTQSPL